ncbi:MAG: FtsQ-type POTRA domain-containing protein [Chloroflexi bacterium]|nr:FtsQ-type POTRA domain-containing protein [Chloroflexota bacterium]
MRGISVSGTTYLDTREIFRYTGIAEQHILQVNPERVRAALLEIPTIADAVVTLTWPPDMIRIRIIEREPVLIWNQNGVEAWVDIHGRVLTAPPEERPDLLRVNTRGIEEPISINDTIPQDVVDGARQLKDLVCPASESCATTRFSASVFVITVAGRHGSAPASTCRSRSSSTTSLSIRCWRAASRRAWSTSPIPTVRTALDASARMYAL